MLFHVRFFVCIFVITSSHTARSDDYVAFGQSGSDSASTLTNADVFVAFQTNEVVDYYVTDFYPVKHVLEKR